MLKTTRAPMDRFFLLFLALNPLLDIASGFAVYRINDSVGMVSNWKKRGPIYEVPLRTLFSSKMKNLITAGRCTCVDETLWDVMRVIPCCAVTGQAAGIAAAMTDDFSVLDVALLQRKLQEKGVVLHEKDLFE